MSKQSIITIPSKVCPECDKVFKWQKRLAKRWEYMIYCSENCKDNATSRRYAKSA